MAFSSPCTRTLAYVVGPATSAGTVHPLKLPQQVQLMSPLPRSLLHRCWARQPPIRAITLAFFVSVVATLTSTSRGAAPPPSRPPPERAAVLETAQRRDVSGGHMSTFRSQPPCCVHARTPLSICAQCSKSCLPLSDPWTSIARIQGDVT